jgi:hypothetical protein
MVPNMFGRFATAKTLIRVAIAVLGMCGIAHAQSTGQVTPHQSGYNYNFMAGGGG